MRCGDNDVRQARGSRAEVRLESPDPDGAGRVNRTGRVRSEGGPPARANTSVTNQSRALNFPCGWLLRAFERLADNPCHKTDLNRARSIRPRERQVREQKEGFPSRSPADTFSA